MTTPHLVVVMTTVADRGQADSLGRALISRRLAACVQLIDITSHYRWEGTVQNDSEVLLLIKTPPEALDSLMSAAANMHPYDTPELIAVPSIAVEGRYAAWAASQVDVEDG